MSDLGACVASDGSFKASAGNYAYDRTGKSFPSLSEVSQLSKAQFSEDPTNDSAYFSAASTSKTIGNQAPQHCWLDCPKHFICSRRIYSNNNECGILSSQTFPSSLIKFE